jgi:hypothetical protein
MTEFKNFPVQTILAYQTVDGQKFFTPAEAREHTRNELYKAIIAQETNKRPEFARLDPALLLDFIRAASPYLPGAIAAPFDPAPLPTARPAPAQPAAPAAAIPAARPDASPSPSVADKLMTAARTGLEAVRQRGPAPEARAEFRKDNPTAEPDPFLTEMEKELAIDSLVDIRDSLSRGFRGQ